MSSQTLIRVTGLLTLIISAVLLYLSWKIYTVSGAGILDAQFLGRTPDSVNSLLSAYQETDAPQIYAKIQLLDFLYPVVYGTFGAAVLYQLFRPRPTAIVCLVMIFAAIADLLENRLLGKIVDRYPTLDHTVIAQSSLLTQLKYGLIVLSIIIFFFGLRRLSREIDA